MKRRRHAYTTAVMPGMPSDAEMQRMAARQMARTMMETDPSMKRMQAEMERELSATARRVMSGSRPMVKRRRR